MATLRPLDEEAIIAAARETGAIVTAEEHLVHCGLGSMVSQVVTAKHPVPMGFVGMKDRYAESGAPGSAPGEVRPHRRRHRPRSARRAQAQEGLTRMTDKAKAAIPRRGPCVAVLYTSAATVLDDIGRAMRLADYARPCPPTSRPLLKINISWQHYYPACSTTPLAARRRHPDAPAGRLPASIYPSRTAPSSSTPTRARSRTSTRPSSTSTASRAST